MHILLEFIRPHGWLPLIAMLLVNGALCYRFGGRVLFATIPILSVVYGLLDFAWIRAEMDRPDWDGSPDQDAVFMFGMLLRGFVGAMLLFASFVAAIMLSNLLQRRPSSLDSRDTAQREEHGSGKNLGIHPITPSPQPIPSPRVT